MTNAENDDDLEIIIAEPCSQAWDELPGDGEQRYCSKCALNVLFGPSFTRKEALRLVQNSTGRVCMRLEFDARGVARFKPEPVPPHAVVRGSRWIASASAALLAACARTEADVPALAMPVVPEAVAPIEPAPCREATILDPLPVVEVQKRQPIPPAPETLNPEQGIIGHGGGVTTVRRFTSGRGAVVVRRPDKPPTTPK